MKVLLVINWKECQLWDILRAFLVSCVILLCPYVLLSWNQDCWEDFNNFSGVGICVDSVTDSCTSWYGFCMSMLFKCSLFNVLFCSDAGTIILPPFMAIPLINTLLSLNDHYGCRSFCPSLMTSQAILILRACLSAPHLGLLTLLLLLSCSLV